MPSLIYRYAVGLQAAGVEVGVVCLTPLRSESTVAKFQSIGIRPVSLLHDSRVKMPLTVFRLWRHLRRQRADVVHSFLPTAAWVSTAASGRIAHFTTIVTTPDAEQRRQFSVYRYVRALGTTVLAISRGAGTASLDLGIQVDEVTWPGLDPLDLPHPPAGREGMSFLRPSASPLLLSVGRLVAVKNHETAIRALSLIIDDFPEAVLIIAGGGRESEVLSLQSLASELNVADAVVLLGETSEISQLMSVCDVYVSSSLAEGFVGYATLEAALAGIPIVASNIPAVTELFEDGVHAILADPRSAVDFARGIRKLLEDADFAASLAVSAKSITRDMCSISAAADRLLKVYGQRVNER